MDDITNLDRAIQTDINDPRKEDSTLATDGGASSPLSEAVTNTCDVPDVDKLSVTDSKRSDDELPNIVTTHPIVHQYLLDNAPEYRDVDILRRKGWGSELGDKHFQTQRERADNADKHTRNIFYHMMCEIAEELDKVSGILADLKQVGGPKALDLCMAPGGFAGSVLRLIRGSSVCGITLPVEEGGHPMTMPFWELKANLKTLWLDITMLATEMGLTDIPSEHPEAAKFSTVRPFEGEAFDLVFCDGQVLRTQPRPSYREIKERVRLLNSQLVLALQRIKPGGNLVIRLHKIEAVDTATLLQKFSSFSTIMLHKPAKWHGIRSSFYMIAKNVQPQSAKALEAVNEWKKQWVQAALDTDEATIQSDALIDAQADRATELIQTFGSELVALARPIWKIQANALDKSPFLRDNSEKQMAPTVYRPPKPRSTADNGASRYPGLKPTSDPWKYMTPRSLLTNDILGTTPQEPAIQENQPFSSSIKTSPSAKRPAVTIKDANGSEVDLKTFKPLERATPPSSPFQARRRGSSSAVRIKDAYGNEVTFTDLKAHSPESRALSSTNWRYMTGQRPVVTIRDQSGNQVDMADLRALRAGAASKRAADSASWRADKLEHPMLESKAGDSSDVGDKAPTPPASPNVTRFNW
ncbi:uncharacterized protein JN550_000200 [Neoarthrinium moseri]|uniref:uncharacterized protein n=1 Tax=Neoarthrinium moseri TaxID=1658444 RepID=UPI001FDCE021|nr:uncharacterized protein JN550_000200 [Neoarthrinium moseri]KAI1878018.1 hypothetical protein JN550_000200 [Neoarthrinium moseri]